MTGLKPGETSVSAIQAVLPPIEHQKIHETSPALRLMSVHANLEALRMLIQHTSESRYTSNEWKLRKQYIQVFKIPKTVEATSTIGQGYRHDLQLSVTSCDQNPRDGPTRRRLVNFIALRQKRRATGKLPSTFRASASSQDSPTVFSCAESTL